MSKGIMGSHGTDDEDDNPVESMPPFLFFLGTRNETQLGSVLVVGQHSIEAKYFNTFYSFTWTMPSSKVILAVPVARDRATLSVQASCRGQCVQWMFTTGRS
jgi:hypothetical protein